MVMWRDQVVHEILTCLGLEGHRVPHRVHEVLMKFWLLMETKTGAAREAYLSSPQIWTDTDIMFFHLFLIKLDMRFTHPVIGNGICELSHMLLTQKTLSILLDVLTGKKKIDYDEASDMLVKTYLQEDLDTDTHSWLDNEIENGIPEEEWGINCREGWHMDGKRMEPAVDMVITEGIKRDLHPERSLLDFMLYGYVEPDEDKNMPYPRCWRGETKVNAPKETWPVERVRRPMLEKLDKRYGDGEEPEPVLKITVPDTSGGNDDIEIEAIDMTDEMTEELGAYKDQMAADIERL